MPPFSLFSPCFLSNVIFNKQGVGVDPQVSLCVKYKIFLGLGLWGPRGETELHLGILEDFSANVLFSWALKDGRLCPCKDQVEDLPSPVRTF